MKKNKKVMGKNDKSNEPSTIQILLNSFLIIPLVVFITALILFGGYRLIIHENFTVERYLHDIQDGNKTKRWQSAFELSKLLAKPEQAALGRHFHQQIKTLFDSSIHEDPKVRQFLALAMGRTGDLRYQPTLHKALLTEKNNDSLSYIIHSLGLLRARDSVPELIKKYNNSDDFLRLAVIIALGTISDLRAQPTLVEALKDTEVNVRWDAAVGLAKMGSDLGKSQLLNLMNRDYLSKFHNVDAKEQSETVLAAIQASALLKNPELKKQIKKLSISDPEIAIKRLAMDVLVN